MKEMSHASFAAAAAISPEFWYSTSFNGTCNFAAAALASSTVTPRGSPDAGSRVAQKVEAAGPTAMATRSEPVGAMSRVDEGASAVKTGPAKPTSRATPAMILPNDDITLLPPVNVSDVWFSIVVIAAKAHRRAKLAARIAGSKVLAALQAAPSAFPWTDHETFRAVCSAVKCDFEPRIVHFVAIDKSLKLCIKLLAAEACRGCRIKSDVRPAGSGLQSLAAPPLQSAAFLE